MISLKDSVKIARKWQRVAAMRKKRISFPQVERAEEVLAHRGHFVNYSIDRKRFMFPIRFSNNCVIHEMFRLFEEEFGLPSNGPITLPCDTMFMDYTVSMIQKHANAEIEKAPLMSITIGQQLLICSH